jgi:hypothetical protein
VNLRLDADIPALYRRCDELRVDTKALLADFDLSDESVWHVTAAAQHLGDALQSLKFAEMMSHDE